MFGKRGGLQARLNATCDLFLWCLEKGVLVGAVGYVATVAKPNLIGLRWLYDASQLVLFLAAYLRTRSAFFIDLDAAQKAAPSPQASLARTSPWPAIVAVVIISLVRSFVSIMATVH